MLARSIPLALCLAFLPAAAGAEEPATERLVCKLDPACAKPGFRGVPFGKRGVTPDFAEPSDPPLTVNLYVNFAFDSTDLETDLLITLDQLGAALQDLRLAKFRFLIAGHTDAKGSDDYNLALSRRRAEAVRQYLLRKFPIAAERIETRGYGKSRLLDPARPEDGVNRRVQVTNLAAGTEVDQNASH